MVRRGPAVAVGAGGVLVAALAVGAVLAARGGESRAADPADPADRASVLVERLGCEVGTFTAESGAGWWAADARDCREGPVLARAYGSLAPGTRVRAVEILASGDYDVGGMTDWCAGNTDDAGDLYLVAGDAWVVVVLGRDDADTVADRLGGDVRPEPLPTLPPRESEPFQCLP